MFNISFFKIEGQDPEAVARAMESVDLGLTKLAEIRECVDAIALDGAKFFDKGMVF